MVQPGGRIAHQQPFDAIDRLARRRGHGRHRPQFGAAPVQTRPQPGRGLVVAQANAQPRQFGLRPGGGQGQLDGALRRAVGHDQFAALVEVLDVIDGGVGQLRRRRRPPPGARQANALRQRPDGHNRQQAQRQQGNRLQDGRRRGQYWFRSDLHMDASRAR